MAWYKFYQKHSFIIFILYICFHGVSLEHFGIRSLPLLMPDVRPLQNDTYLCTGYKMPSKDSEYIVEFHPNASMSKVHHILIYGCEYPGRRERDTPRLVWDCGEMAQSRSKYTSGPVCKSGSQVIYAWAMEAPALKLPEGVGFQVGAGTGIGYLVLQVHYNDVTTFIKNIGESDNSGVILNMLPGRNRRISKNAGVYLLGTGGFIPKHKTVHMETSCEITEPVEIFPFAVRVHTHKLGTVVSGYRIDKEGKWERIAKHNPQLPQMFYPLNKHMVIREGDILAARCTMENFRDVDVTIGSTVNDEMCNFYMMYYMENDKPLNKKYCFTAGPPIYYWKWDPKIGEVPPEIHEDASELSENENM